MNRFGFVLPALSVCFSLSSQVTQNHLEKDLFTDLVAIVAEKPLSTQQPEVPSLLVDIIEDYYAESIIDDSVPHDVLSYVTSVYSEHGYHDTGNWAPSTKRKIFYYQPYTGDLPEYDVEDFQQPVKGRLTSCYGFRPKFGRFHHGVDVAVNMGDTIKCSLPGIVTRTGYDTGGYGRYVVVAHSGGMETLYGHLQVSLVKPGHKISAGQPLGLGGATGNATGPHLHFETRYRGVPVDPIFWISNK